MHTRAFTLIELMVAITLVFVVIGLTYVPYAYEGKKLALKQAGKELSQSLYEVRNLAVSGTASGSNLSVGLYLSSDETTKNTLYFYGYPHGITPTNPISGTLLEARPFPVGVEFRSVAGQENALFLFEAISGSGSYFSFENATTLTPLSESILDIEYAYQSAEPGTPLYHTLQYFTQTNIVDY